MKCLINRDDFNFLIRGKTVTFTRSAGTKDEQVSEIALADIGYSGMMRDLAEARLELFEVNDGEAH